MPYLQVLVLENVRFYKEETKNDAEFAKKVHCFASGFFGLSSFSGDHSSQIPRVQGMLLPSQTICFSWQNPCMGSLSSGNELAIVHLSAVMLVSTLSGHSKDLLLVVNAWLWHGAD